jgi:hypothetical protein
VDSNGETEGNESQRGEGAKVREAAASLMTGILGRQLEKPSGKERAAQQKFLIGQSGRGPVKTRLQRVDAQVSDESDHKVKVIERIDKGKTAVERKPDNLKQGSWQGRPISKRKKKG